MPGLSQPLLMEQLVQDQWTRSCIHEGWREAAVKTTQKRLFAGINNRPKFRLQNMCIGWCLNFGSVRHAAGQLVGQTDVDRNYRKVSRHTKDEREQHPRR